MRFVTISEPVGWDTHADNFKRLRENLPVVDQAVSALLDDLAERGMLRRHAGDDVRRVRPHAEDQQAGGPRPLGHRR